MSHIWRFELICLFIAVSITGFASEWKLIPDSIAAADENAAILVEMINAGKTVVIDRTYYIGSAKQRIHNDITIKGSGTLITTRGNNFYINAPISICISNITLKTTAAVTAISQNRFLINEGINYHRRLIVKNCKIRGVRVYTHIAADVDQVEVKDGVRLVRFLNNSVSEIGAFVLLLSNCKSEEVRIENNTITRMYALGFGLGVDNNYKSLGFSRMKKVFFRNNQIDNNGLVITDADTFGSAYMTPILCEADYCQCENNTIKNILSTKHDSFALYPFYLSCREVVIRNNFIQDCIHLTNSDNNEMFKCKNSTVGRMERRIEGNKYVVTRECLQLLPLDEEIPCMRFTGFQSKEIGDVTITNNEIDLACNFVFGAAMMCSYDSFVFENNRIFYNAEGNSAREWLRLRPASIRGCPIIIRNNVVSSRVEATDVYGIFKGDCSGYRFLIANNELSGCLPTGDGGLGPKSPDSFKSYGNRVNLGRNRSIIRISHDVSCDDTYFGGDHYSMYLYPGDLMNGSLIFHFEGTMPVSVLTFTVLPNAGSCELVVSDGIEREQYSCIVDGVRIYIKSISDGMEKVLKKGEKVSRVYVGKPGRGIMASNGEIVYYTLPSDKKNLTLQVSYKTTR